MSKSQTVLKTGLLGVLLTAACGSNSAQAPDGGPASANEGGAYDAGKTMDSSVAPEGGGAEAGRAEGGAPEGGAPEGGGAEGGNDASTDGGGASAFTFESG